MQSRLIDFKRDFRSTMLDLLWRQWTAMGVAGQVAPQERIVIDPEALLLISCTVARHDPRLFDAILDWMGLNGRYLNVHRLQRMLQERLFTGGAVFAAAAASIYTAENKLKWSRSIKAMEGVSPANQPEALFFLDENHPLPVMREPDPVFLAHGFLRDAYVPRATAQPFRPDLAANFLLRLRAFLGVNARCEILTFLLLCGRGSPRAMARASGYFPATVSKALAEMEDSGYLASRVEGRHRYYTLESDVWRAPLIGRENPVWINWIPLFSALEQTWLFLHDKERDTQSPLAQASDLRRALKATLLNRIASSGLRIAVADDSRHTGEELIPFFMALMGDVLAAMARLGSPLP